MSILNFFKFNDEAVKEKYSKLHYSLEKEYPTISEEKLVTMACISGLLARVAYVDFNLDVKEVAQIKQSLSSLSITEDLDTDVITDIATKHVKDMAGLENHLYVHPLKKLLSHDERYKVLQSLFLVAACDGSVESVESEEIRMITKGLELSAQHFIAARAEVAEFLKVLKK